MKKISIIFLAVCTLLSLVACSGGDFNDGEGFLDGDQMAAMPEGVDVYENGIPNENQNGNLDGDYVGIIETPFISTETENVSTFAADVDTASYSLFRRLVNEGYHLDELIATAGTSIRTEEMVNYFNYGYAEPNEGELFSAQMQIAPCPWNENAKLLILGLQAKKLETASKNNLVFLVDVSGSMNSEDKLGLLKKRALHTLPKSLATTI